MNTQEVLVVHDHVEHAAVAAERMGRVIAEAVVARGVARVALSGGTTPVEAYQRVAGLSLPFDRVQWFWVDERAVPPDHPRSNYGAAARALGLAGGAHGRAFRMEAERALETAARDYEGLLRRAFGVAAAVAFDLLVMGVGDDGHTASLFPKTGAVALEDRLVLAVAEQPDKRLEARLTLTAPVIRQARETLVLVRGVSKRAVVAAARKPGSEDEVPARVLQRTHGKVAWLLDEAAARG